MSSQRHKVYVQGLAANGADEAQGEEAMGFTPEPVNPNAMTEFGSTNAPIIDSLQETYVNRSGGVVFVHGRRFEKVDNVFIDNVPYKTAFVSSIRLTLTVVAADNLELGVHKVTVGNKDRRSNEQNLTVI